MKSYKQIMEEKLEAAITTMKNDEKAGMQTVLFREATHLDGSYYFDLTYRAAGELQKLKVIKAAKELGVKSQIIDLIQDTIFVGYVSFGMQK